MDIPYYREYELPWTSAEGQEQKFRRLLAIVFAVLLFLGVVWPYLPTPAVDPNAVEALERIAFELEGAAENWGRSTNIMCADCSRGLPHEHPDSERQPAHPHCGLAAKNDDHAEQIIRTWLDTAAKADLIRWYDPAAGAE